MAKTGLVGYFNPAIPFVVKGETGLVVNSDFWRLWLEQLQTQALALIDLQTDVTGVLPIANGGTNASTANLAFANLSPMTTRGDMITRNATVPIRLAIGAAGTILSSNGTDPSWQSGSSFAGTELAPILMLGGM